MKEIKVTHEEFNAARRLYDEVVGSPTLRFGTTVERNVNGSKYGANSFAKPFGLWRRNDKGKILWHFEFFSQNPLAQPCGQIRGDEDRFRLDMAAAKMFLK